MRAADATYDPDYYPLTRRMFRAYGLYPHPSDDHIGEYLSFAWEACGLHGYDFARADRRRELAWGRITRWARGEEPLSVPEAAGGSAEERDAGGPSPA